MNSIIDANVYQETLLHSIAGHGPTDRCLTNSPCVCHVIGVGAKNAKIKIRHVSGDCGVTSRCHSWLADHEVSEKELILRQHSNSQESKTSSPVSQDLWVFKKYSLVPFFSGIAIFLFGYCDPTAKFGCSVEPFLRLIPVTGGNSFPLTESVSQRLLAFAVCSICQRAARHVCLKCVLMPVHGDLHVAPLQALQLHHCRCLRHIVMDLLRAIPQDLPASRVVRVEPWMTRSLALLAWAFQSSTPQSP